MTVAKSSSTQQHTRRPGVGVARNKRTPTAKAGGSAGGAGGILGTFGPRFNRFQSVNYTALQQGDPEVGASANNKNNNNYLSISVSGSSSEEDLFPTRSSSASPPKRKVRRKMGRRGGYSMRDAFDEGRSVSAENSLLLKKICWCAWRLSEHCVCKTHLLCALHLFCIKFGIQFGIKSTKLQIIEILSIKYKCICM